MRKPKLLSRLSALATALVCAFGFMAQSTSVIAEAAESWTETQKNQQHELEYWGYDFEGSGLPKAYNPIKGTIKYENSSKTIAQGMTNPSFNERWATDFYYWIDESGRVAYCLQMGIESNDSDEMKKIDFNKPSEVEKLYDKNTNNLLRYASIYTFKLPTNRTTVSTSNTSYCKYGYTEEEELVASQVLVWAISSKVYFDSSSTSIKTGTYEDKLLKCITCTRSNASTHVANVRACYQKMKADILGHLTIPNGTASVITKAELDKATYKLTFNPSSGKWVATIPSNAKMKEFDLKTAISGVTVTHSGNNLVFTCTTAGAKTLTGKQFVELKKSKATNAKKMDKCSPLIYATSKEPDNGTTSQAKIAYYSNDDPVKAYAAFEFATGDLNVVKKINENGTLIDATVYEYIYFDETLGTDVKITWDKKYSKNSETGEWDILKTEYNGSQLNIGLRNIIRFKIRTVDNQYIKVRRTGEAGSGSYEFVSFVSTKDEGTEFALSYGLGNEGDAPAGTVVINGIPAMSPYPYLIEEYTSVYAENFAEYGLTSSVANGSVTANSTATANLVNKLVANGDLTINKVITLSDNTTPSDELYNAVGFKLYDEATQSYASLNLVNAETGTYSVTDFGETEESATTIKLGTTSKTATIQSLNAGDYTVYEMNSDNFTAQSDNLTVTMQSTGEQTVTFYNEEKTGIVKAVKTTEGQKNIDGIDFRLVGTSDSGRPIDLTATTGADGVATFPSVPIGKYTLSEVEASVNTDIYFTAESQEVTVLYEQTATKTFYNAEKTGTVKVVKTTEENKNIEGIEFTLTGTSDSGNAVNLTATTDANGEAYFYDIPVGSNYTLSENGDTVKTDIYFTAENQTVTVLYDETTEKEFENLEKTGAITVTKSTVGDINISDIAFTLSGTSNSGRDISITAVTDADGKATFNGVPLGTYTIPEDADSVPIGYLVADEQTVTVTYNATVDVEIFNDEISGTIEVNKSTTGMVNLEGIEFFIKGDVASNGRVIYAKAVTDENGKALFYETDSNYEYILSSDGKKDNLLPIGDYVIIEGEDSVPYGYLVADEQTVTVVANDTVVADVFNKEQTGTVSVSKSTIGKLNIEGITLKLTGTSDTGRAIELTATTNAEGKAVFENVPIGTYTVSEVESSVNVAYLVADEQSVEVLYNETANVSFFNDEKMGSITVQKRTEGMLNIEGLGFTLSGTADNGREITEYGLTDENGQLTFIVPIGTYTITEDESTVPYAYLVATPQEVVITYNEDVTADFYNEEKKGQVTVQKSTEGMTDLEGITFRLTGTSDSGREINAMGVSDVAGVVQFYLTDAEDNIIYDELGEKIDLLPIGSYTITEDETTVPFGYLTAAPTEVIVNYADTTETEIVNDTWTGEIYITKTDVATGDLIPNCKIAILDEDGNVIISDYTDENGEVRFTLEAGVYYYQELEAAPEYVLDTTAHKFEITEEGQIIKAEMTNRKVKSDKPPHTGMSTEQHSDYTFFVLLAFCGVLTFVRKKKAN